LSRVSVSIHRVNAVPWKLQFQDLNQPKSLYGLDRARTLMNSMETQIFTRQSGLETSEYVERRLGRTSDFAHGTSVHDDQMTESESEQAVSLL
jgi:type IV secretory pathway TraG/TraD family ATPase VirD4